MRNYLIQNYKNYDKITIPILNTIKFYNNLILKIDSYYILMALLALFF